jgi:hypothetical protein
MAGARTMMRLALAAVGRGWKLRSASALSWQCALFWQCAMSWQCVFWKPIYGHRRGRIKQTRRQPRLRPVSAIRWLGALPARPLIRTRIARNWPPACCRTVTASAVPVCT